MKPQRFSSNKLTKIEEKNYLEKKVILSCLEKKSDDYSLEGQYPLVEEEQKLEV